MVQKLVFGSKIGFYLRTMGLKKAKQLLDEGDQNISSVSFKVGSSSPQYFSTCFQCRTGQMSLFLIHRLSFSRHLNLIKMRTFSRIRHIAG